MENIYLIEQCPECGLYNIDYVEDPEDPAIGECWGCGSVIEPIGKISHSDLHRIITSYLNKDDSNNFKDCCFCNMGETK